MRSLLFSATLGIAALAMTFTTPNYAKAQDNGNGLATPANAMRVDWDRRHYRRWDRDDFYRPYWGYNWYYPGYASYYYAPGYTSYYYPYPNYSYYPGYSSYYYPPGLQYYTPLYRSWYGPRAYLRFGW